MNSGKYIFSQVVEFIPKYEFDKLVKQYNGDFHTRNLSCYNQLLHLLFGQLTVCNSLRDICLCLKAHEKSLYPNRTLTAKFKNTIIIINEKREKGVSQNEYLIYLESSAPVISEITSIVTITYQHYTWEPSLNDDILREEYEIEVKLTIPIGNTKSNVYTFISSYVNGYEVEHYDITEKMHSWISNPIYQLENQEWK
ncbi:DUF4372 domain-containing protein [Bacteroides sp. 51]|uniref:DUF4372 domain-containing protein n=1 Tax=Bacteroides sp. 51 TaxID=2302938 RepID=UPI001EF1FB7E|nr:DUF4372 domain-containing protein [Bacteroides sp. 51]